MGLLARFIRLNAFSSKAMIKTVHGRSSDLFLLADAFPEACFQWLLVVLPATYHETYSSGTVQDFHLIPF